MSQLTISCNTTVVGILPLDYEVRSLLGYRSSRPLGLNDLRLSYFTPYQLSGQNGHLWFDVAIAFKVFERHSNFRLPPLCIVVHGSKIIFKRNRFARWCV